MSNLAYEDLIKLDEESFRKQFALRLKSDRASLLREMVEHEEKTFSYAKAHKPEQVSSTTSLMYDVFVKDKSEQTVELLEKMSNLTQDHVPKDDSSQASLVDHAMSAKAATDWAALHKEKGDE